MYNIIITNMMTGTQQVIEFTNYQKSVNHYIELCNMHNMDPQEDMMDGMYTTKGGIGHDYRIELVINN